VNVLQSKNVIACFKKEKKEHKQVKNNYNPPLKKNTTKQNQQTNIVGASNRLLQKWEWLILWL